MSVTTIMISDIESKFSSEFIANLFWRQHIAEVSSITIMPYLKDDKVYKIAYITIREWCDSEIAYNFMCRLKNNGEAKIIYDDEKAWSVKMNTHNNGNILLENFTKIFNRKYYINLESNVTLRKHQLHFPKQIFC